MQKPKRLTAGVVALVAATLFTGLVASALGQEADIPSVDVVPAETKPTDPNGGQWFFAELAPGTSATLRAFIRNPAKVAQTVKLYLRDLEFAADGTPTIKEGEQTEVGAWGRPQQPQVTVAAEAQVETKVDLTVPAGAEPGDHVGAIVAESEPQASGTLKIVKRVATRLYVTVPGEATRSLRIESVSAQIDSWLAPRKITVTSFVRNTGRVRLEVSVKAGEAAARGPKVLLSRSVERYIAGVAVPFYGGPVGYEVEALDTKSGLVRVVNASTFVIPWGLLMLIGLAVLLGWVIRRAWVKRTGRVEDLRSDLRRLEALVTQRPIGPVAAPVAYDEGENEIDAIMAALKRARRTGSQPSLERLALALHDAGGDALDVLLEAIKGAGPERMQLLVDAVASYGAAEAPRPEPVTAAPKKKAAANKKKAAAKSSRVPSKAKSSSKRKRPGIVLADHIERTRKGDK